MAASKVGSYSDLANDQISAVSVDGVKVALYKIKDDVFATNEMCSHDECSLEDFGKIRGEEVECTCHGAMFRIKTGEVTRGPATSPLKTYPVKIVDGEIWIEV